MTFPEKAMHPSNSIRRISRSALGIALFFQFMAFLTGCSHIQIDNKPLSRVWAEPFRVQIDTKRGSVDGLPSQLITTDINGDRESEIISIINNRKFDSISMLIIRDIHGNNILAYNDTAIFSYIDSYIGESYNEIRLYFSAVRKKDLYIFYLSPQNPVPPTAIAYWKMNQILKDGGGYCGFRLGKIIPKPHPILVVSIITTFFTSPRHIVLIDLEKKKVIRDVEIGPFPQSICVGNFVGDERPEILIGTWAPSNGAIGSGMDDGHSWLILMDLEGNILHKQEMGRYGSFLYLSPQPFYGPDGYARVLFVRANYGREEMSPDHVGVWSFATRNDYSKLEFPQNIITNSPFFFQDTETGKQIAIFAMNDGTFALVNQDLQIVATRRFTFDPEWKVLTPVLAENILGDARKEIVLIKPESAYITDNRLNILASIKGTLIRSTVMMNSEAHKRLLLAPSNSKRIYFAVINKNPWYYGLRIGAPLVLIIVVGSLYYSIHSFRKNVNLRRIQEESSFRSWVLESVDMGILIFDAAGRLKTVNRRAREILNWPARLPEKLEDLAKSLASRQYAELSRILQQLSAQNARRIQREIELEQGQDRRRYLVTADLLQNDKGRMVGKVLSIKDVTELVESREFLAWTRFARQLAHDIKSSLSPIQLATEKLRRQFRDLDQTAISRSERYLSYIEKEMEQIRTVAESLMQLAELEKGERNFLDINLVVRDAVERFEPHRLAGIELQLELCRDHLPKIRGSRDQLALVILNLLKNSSEAILDSGLIRIQTFSARGLPDGSEKERGYVVIEISDTGGGIPEDIRDKIFQPFFSSKATGTGLGLPISKKIIEDHGGKIFFESRPDLGTTFWIYLPVCEG